MRIIYVTAILFIFLLTAANAQNATRNDAINAIQQAEQDMNEIMEAGFSVSYINDTLISAKQALERADFAGLIRQNATGDLAEKAKKALEGLDYDMFTYDEVLKYTREISSRKQKAYELSDSIRALEIKIEGYKKQVVPLSPIGSVNRKIDTTEPESVLKEAKIAFEKERYDETETLLAEANKNLETKKAELTIVNVITTSGKSFIEKNWRGILIFTAVTIISGLMIWRSYRIKMVRDKLKKLKIELGSLQKLMEKTQIERFKEGNISESVYNIRMEKYTKRLNEVKQTIPVLEEMLKGKKK
jgi:hypothetical protein